MYNIYSGLHKEVSTVMSEQYWLQIVVYYIHIDVMIKVTYDVEEYGLWFRWTEEENFRWTVDWGSKQQHMNLVKIWMMPCSEIRVAAYDSEQQHM